MTRDHQRGLEAHGVGIVNRYCLECRRDIRIADELNEARDWAAHVTTHRRCERGAWITWF